MVLAAAASLVSLAGAGAAADAMVAGSHGTPGRGVAWTTVTVCKAVTHVTAEVKFRPRPWGTEMSVAVAGLKDGIICELW